MNPAYVPTSPPKAVAAKRGRTRNASMVVAFLVWPFLAFLLALRNIGNRTNLRIILAFFVLYGLTFVVNPAMDSARYAQDLISAYEQPFSEFFGILSQLYGAQDSVDIVQPLLTYVVSRFTDDHRLLFACFAFVFGFFYLKSVQAGYFQYRLTRTWNALVFLLFLPWIVPIFDINGFRMWTATWIFFYGTYQVLYHRRNLFLLLAFSSALVHFSFLSVCLALLVYLLLGNRNGLYLVLAVVTFFVSEFPVDFIREYGQLLGEGLSAKIQAYTHEQYMAQLGERSEQAAWFIRLSGPALYYYYSGLVLYVFWRVRKKAVDTGFANLFAFMLLLLSFVNMVALLPSGGRFRSLFYIVATVVMVMYYARYHYSRRIHWLMVLGLAPMALKALIAFRIGSETVNTILFFPSPVIIGMFDISWPIKDWLF